MPVGREPMKWLWMFVGLAAVFAIPAFGLGYKWLFRDEPNVKGECTTRRGRFEDCYSGETVNMVVSIIFALLLIGTLWILVTILVDRRRHIRRWEEIVASGTRALGTLASAAPVGTPSPQHAEAGFNLVFEAGGERVVVDKVWVPRSVEPGMVAELAYDPETREGVLLELPHVA